MSGVCGILALDGQPVETEDIERMTVSLERRGPDGTHIWAQDEVGFGHTLLATTPEALIETIPLTHHETGCSITADIRLDNRKELIEALGLCNAGRVFGDAEIVLRSYLKWGAECPSRLLGDFAFALWDPRIKQLFCARDHMGLKQFNYCHNQGRFFVFATEPKAILTHRGVSRAINEPRIGDYLEDLEGLDHTTTFYKDIWRLPPGHCLIASADKLLIRAYWSLQQQPELRLKNDLEYEEVFLEVLTTAISCRLRTNGPVGLLLSGGIDSASIAAISTKLLAQAERAPLSTFSGIRPDPEVCSETSGIISLGRQLDIKPHLVDYATLDADAELLRSLIADIDDPFDGHMNLPRAVYHTASRKRDMKVVLDGVGADVVLSGGNVCAQHLRRGNFLKAIEEARAESAFWGSGGTGWTNTLFLAARRAWVPQAIRDQLFLLRGVSNSGAKQMRLASQDFARSVDLANRKREYEALWTANSARLSMQRFNIISHPHEVAARERYDRVASAFALEPRAPFLDKRLLELCASLPTEQVQRHGWPKHILRRSMDKLLPTEIVWKKGKHHVGGHFSNAILAPEFYPRGEAERSMRSALQPYLSAKAFSNLSETSSGMKRLDNWQTVFYLYVWLEANKTKEF